jgi:hypothetical protein
MNRSSKSDFDEKWDSQSIIEWISSHKQWLLWAALAVFLLLGMTYRWNRSKTIHAESDFLQAQLLFTQLQTNPSSMEDLEKLQAISKQYRELRPKYDGFLAQILLTMGKSEPAQIFANEIFSRTKKDSTTFYQEYSKNSFLMTEGQYATALENSQKLQETLEKTEQDSGAMPVLYLFNLIRLGTIHQQMGNARAELDIWYRLQHLPASLQAPLNTLIHALQMEQIPLTDYIENRIQSLQRT